MLKDVKSRKY